MRLAELLIGDGFVLDALSLEGVVQGAQCLFQRVLREKQRARTTLFRLARLLLSSTVSDASKILMWLIAAVVSEQPRG